jgi:hypothetical protein
MTGEEISKRRFLEVADTFNGDIVGHYTARTLRETKQFLEVPDGYAFGYVNMLIGRLITARSDAMTPRAKEYVEAALRFVGETHAAKAEAAE